MILVKIKGSYKGCKQHTSNEYGLTRHPAGRPYSLTNIEDGGYNDG